MAIQGLEDSYKASLKVYNDYARMHFKGKSEDQRPLLLLRQRNLKINALPEGTIFVDDENYMNVLEIRSPVQIGKPNGKKTEKIVLAKTSLVRQYISPASSKFYACKNSMNTLPFDRILASCQYFDITEHFLKGSDIRELCVANNDQDVNWVVESVGKTFKPGFTMEGLVETDFMTGGDKVPVGFTASFESNAFQFCATLPILKWGRVVRETKEVEPPLTKEQKKAKRAKKEEEKALRKERRKQGLSVETEEELEVRDPPEFFNYNNHMCELSKYHGVVWSNMEKQDIRSVPINKQKCVEKCVEKFKIDPTFYGVVIKPILGCWCAQNMRYSELKSDLPNGKQQIFTGVIRDLEKHSIEMYLGTKENELAFGPNLCFNLLRRVTTVTMSGYLKTFAFKKPDVTFKVNMQQLSGDEYHFSDLKMQPEDGSMIKIFDEIDANIKIESDSYESTHPENLNLKMMIHIKTAGDIHRGVNAEIDALKNDEKSVFDGHVTKFTKARQDLKTKHDMVKGQITAYEKKTMKLKQDFRRESIARARHMKAYQKSCTEECGFAKIPGWSVNNECHSSKDGQKMSCMKFKRDASYASNVGCVASCEAERVKSFSDAKRAHARTVDAGSPLDQRTECKRKGEEFLSKITDYVNKAKAGENTAKARKRAITNAQIDIPSTLDTEVATRTMSHPRCFTFIKNGDSGAPIDLCFDGFKKELAQALYKQNAVSQTNKDNSNELETINAELRNILDKDANSKEYRKYFEMEEEFANCEMVRKAKGKALKAKRHSVQIGEHVRSLPELNKAQFTIFSDNTVDSFEKRSPWEVAKKRDALSLLKHHSDSRLKINTTLSKDDHSCTVAKRASVEFSNIAHYVNKWSEEQASAKRTLVDIKQNLKNDKDFAMLNSHFFQDGNYSTFEQEDMKYWSGRAEKGMQNWLSFEGARIERYNKESMPVIRKQLDFIYSGGKYKNVSDYLLHQGVDGKNAFKRANIQTTSPYTFPEINKDLNALLDERRTLDDVAKDVKNVLKRVDVVYKRSLECKA